MLSNNQRTLSFSRGRTTSANKMKILLLTLVLGVVYADQDPQSETDYSQFSGEWNTIYGAASNIEKISENGPFRAFMRTLDFNSAGDTIHFTFFVKVNGQCRKLSTVATKTAENAYICDYAGKTEIHILHLSQNTIITHFLNEDEEGLVTDIVAFFGKGEDIQQEDIEKFKEAVREKEIPDENIVNIINIDDCPSE
uniref:Lipocalin/cytosolic fatty-acid binding domain-containing protein n=1 Tax=Equus asinus TaxID=9793 RepID=A0A8C4L580_EQUAS|nr:odorant-binding protein-like isoform X2 [Equus asinus]